MSRLHSLLIAVAESDRTFERCDVRGQEMWVGKCIHCKRRITVPLSSKQPASATLEHIVPRTHGGTDELSNLALACAPCNHAKGRNVDCRRWGDPTLQHMIERLTSARAARTRR